MNLNTLFRSILQSGISDDTPRNLARNIYFANIVALIVAFAVGFPFIFISYFFFPPLISIPAAGVATAVLSYLLIRFGLHSVGRLVLGLLPAMLSVIYHASLMMPGEEMVASISLIQLSFALTPFLIFGIRERTYIIFSSIVIFLALVFGVPELAQHLVFELDTDIIRTGVLSYITSGLGVLVAFASLYMLAMITQNAIRQSDKLLAETHNNNATLQASEEELKKRMREIEEAQLEEKKRNWATKGLSELGTLLQSRASLSEICDHILHHLVTYTKATQGGLYLIREEEGEVGEIELVACYAYARKKYLNKRFEVKEGLLGSAYQERDYIHITEIPDSYVHIRSGLGEAPPSTLLIMPMIVNDKVEGLIELATFNRFEEHEIEFLQEAGVTIAAAVSNIKINEQTSKLLIVSQRQAEEMRAQEEEMRQNQEELQATQEEMGRQRSELQKEIEELREQLANIDATA